MSTKSIQQTTPQRGQTKLILFAQTHRLGMWEKTEEQRSYWWEEECHGWIIFSITLLFGDGIYSLRDEGPHLCVSGEGQIHTGDKVKGSYRMMTIRDEQKEERSAGSSTRKKNVTLTPLPEREGPPHPTHHIRPPIKMNPDYPTSTKNGLSKQNGQVYLHSQNASSLSLSRNGKKQH